MDASILSFNEETPTEIYEKLFSCPVGTIFEVYAGDFETVSRRIGDLLYNKTGVFQYAAIVPGLPLFTMYGPDHYIVTRNTLQINL